MVGPTRSGKRHTPVPVFTYVTEPGVPPVAAVRLDQEALRRVRASAHAHDFPGLAYFEQAGGSLRFGDREWQIESGDAYLIAPGDVVDIGDPTGLLQASGWGVFFAPEALTVLGVVGAGSPTSQLGWRAHPLLYPFVRGSANGVMRLRVPPPERDTWVAAITAIHREVTERSDGYRQAAMAHLLLLLVNVSRLAGDAVGDLRLNEQDLLADVFAVIERRFRERLSLSGVAEAVHLSPGYLTTTIRHKTGRTVQDWIVERRMSEARRLLVETDLTVEEIGRRVGYPDPGYFGRAFRRAHSVSPREWRATR